MSDWVALRETSKNPNYHTQLKNLHHHQTQQSKPSSERVSGHFEPFMSFNYINGKFHITFILSTKFIILKEKYEFQGEGLHKSDNYIVELRCPGSLRKHNGLKEQLG